MAETATSATETGPEPSIEDRIGALFGAPPEEDTTEHDETDAELETDAETDEIEDDPEADAEDGAEDAEVRDEPVYTVRVAGEDVEVPLSELLNGYSRTGDYKRKTQQVADMRREVEAEQAAIVQQRDQYAAALPQLRKLIETSIGAEPDPNAFDNRADYLYAKDQWNTAKAQADAVRREEQRIQSEQQAEVANRMEAMKRHHNEQLLQKLPSWSDAAVRQREQTEIVEYLRNEGYEDAELAQLWDHRAIVMARKARLYDQAQRTGKAKVKAVKTTAKTATPGSGDKIDTRGRDYRRNREQLAQKGDARSAGALIGQLMGK